MKTLDNKLIIYDSNCKVCSSLKDIVLNLTSIPEAKVKAYKELEYDLSERVDSNKFRNVMALIDTEGGQTIYGSEGIAHIFSSQYRIADLLFRIPSILRIFDLLYKTQAFNRYIIATPRSQFKCDCYPDRVVRYRICYIVLTVLLSTLLTILFGISLSSILSISAPQAAKQMLLIAGTGWVLQMALAAVAMKEIALDYIGHLGSVMVVGLLVLVPWMVFHFVGGVTTPYIPVISVVMSSAYMLSLHIHRIRHLELSRGWTVSWFVLLQFTAVFWIYFFHIK